MNGSSQVCEAGFDDPNLQRFDSAQGMARKTDYEKLISKGSAFIFSFEYARNSVPYTHADKCADEQHNTVRCIAENSV